MAKKDLIYSDQQSMFGSREIIGFGSDEFSIKELDRNKANKIIVENHYSKKFYNATYIHLGVYITTELVGVLQFGYAMNPASCGSVVEGTELDQYLELNRMWLDDKAPRNSESMAISYAVRYIRSKFNKIKWIQSFADEVDEGNNFDERRTITHARNACFKIAKEIGITYFVQLDDDYGQFKFRFEQEIGNKWIIKNIDPVFDLFLNFYKSINAKAIAFSQGGDHIGGFTVTKLKRKCMNSFFCSTEREFQFVGAMNEDVNTYTTLGSRGDLFFTFTSLQLDQKQTQSQTGGITDMYLRFGTYCKAFTTTMMQPSSCKVYILADRNAGRIHHSINWGATTPMIVDEKYRKASTSEGR